MYVRTNGMSGYRGMGAAGDPPNANAGISKAFFLSSSGGDTYLNWTDNGGSARSAVLPRYGTWTIYGNDPDAQLALDGQGQHGLIQSTVRDSGFNLPTGYGYQGTGYFSQTPTGICAGTATLQRPSCSNSFGCMTDEQFRLAQATCDNQPAMNATGCPGGWIPELRVSDCSPGQNYKQAFYNKLFSLKPPVAISNVVRATTHPYGTTSPDVVDYNTPLPTMVSLAGGGSAPSGSIVINSFPTGSQPANAFVSPPVLSNLVVPTPVTSQPQLIAPAVSAPQSPPQYSTLQVAQPPTAAQQQAQTQNPPQTQNQTQQPQYLATPQSFAPGSVLQLYNSQQGTQYPSTSAPSTSSAPGILDSVTSWISANPLLAGAGALGVLFLFSSGGRR